MRRERALILQRIGVEIAKIGLAFSKDPIKEAFN